MVTCTNKEPMKKSLLSNGNVTIDCDNPKDYGGDGYVFGPHDFIEAGYAACLNAGTRSACEKKGVPYEKIVVTVQLNHDDPETTYLRSKIDIVGAPEEEAKKIIEEEYQNCLVKQTLSKNIVFEPLAE